MRKKNYPVIDLYETGQNIKNLILLKGLTVKDVQDYLELGTPQSIYHWSEGGSVYILSDLHFDELVRNNRIFQEG